MVTSTAEALRAIATLLDDLPDLPEHMVTVYSHCHRISLLFGAGPDEELRRDAVRRVLAALGEQPRTAHMEYGGTGSIGRYTVEVSTGFD